MDLASVKAIRLASRYPRENKTRQDIERDPVNKNAFLRALLGLTLLAFGSACGGGGGGGGGAVGGGGVGGTPPQTPLYFDSSSTVAITLGWQPAPDPLPNERYRLYRKLANQAQFALLHESTATTYSDYQVVAGTTYQYYVTATTGPLESPPTEWATVTARYNGIGPRIAEFARVNNPQQAMYPNRVAPDNAGGYYVVDTFANPPIFARKDGSHQETSRHTLNGLLALYEFPDGRSLVLTHGGAQIASEATSPGTLSNPITWPSTGMMTSYQALIGGYDADPIVVTQVGSARITAQGTFSNYRSGGGSSSTILCGDAAGQHAHRVELTSQTQAHIRRWTDSAGWATSTIALPTGFSANAADNLCGTLQLLDGRIAVIGVEQRDQFFRSLACYFVSTSNVVSGPSWLDNYGFADNDPGTLRFRFRTSSARGWRTTADRDYCISIMRAPNGDIDIAWRKRYAAGQNMAAQLVINRLYGGSTSWVNQHRFAVDVGTGVNHMSACHDTDSGYIVCWGPGPLYGDKSYDLLTFRRWKIYPSGALDIGHAADLNPESNYYNGVVGWVRPTSVMAVAIVGGVGYDCAMIGSTSAGGF